jgi:hypothetical protein
MTEIRDVCTLVVSVFVFVFSFYQYSTTRATKWTGTVAVEPVLAGPSTCSVEVVIRQGRDSILEQSTQSGPENLGWNRFLELSVFVGALICDEFSCSNCGFQQGGAEPFTDRELTEHAAR